MSFPLHAAHVRRLYAGKSAAEQSQARSCSDAGMSREAISKPCSSSDEQYEPSERRHSMMKDPQLTPHFNLSEFRCPCCGAVEIDNARKLASQLEVIRSVVGPVVIRSGCRCANRNAAVGGKPNSAHLRSLAADCLTQTDRYRFDFLRAAVLAGFSRIGVAKTTVHVDIDTSLDQHVVWTYYA